MPWNVDKKINKIKYNFRLTALLLLLIGANSIMAQDGSVGIGTRKPNNKAVLDIVSTSKVF